MALTCTTNCTTNYTHASHWYIRNNNMGFSIYDNMSPLLHDDGSRQQQGTCVWCRFTFFIVYAAKH